MRCSEDETTRTMQALRSTAFSTEIAYVTDTTAQPHAPACTVELYSSTAHYSSTALQRLHSTALCTTPLLQSGVVLVFSNSPSRWAFSSPPPQGLGGKPGALRLSYPACPRTPLQTESGWGNCFGKGRLRTRHGRMDVFPPKWVRFPSNTVLPCISMY